MRHIRYIQIKREKNTWLNNIPISPVVHILFVHTAFIIFYSFKKFFFIRNQNVLIVNQFAAGSRCFP